MLTERHCLKNTEEVSQEVISLVDVAKIKRAIWENKRASCILGTDDMHGLEVLCQILGYNDIDDFHREEFPRIEAVNPYVAHLALLKKPELKKDDLHIAREKLAKRYKKSEFGRNDMKRLWLWARGHLKTSVVDVAHSIQLMLIDPNIRLMIMHNVLGEAQKILGQIKQHFLYNEQFRHYFPEFCPEEKKSGKIDWGTVDIVTLPNRTIVGIKEQTIEVCGVGKIKTGSHFDYMKKDDLVTRDSVNTADLLQQSIDADDMSQFLFDNYEMGLEDYIGTRYHFSDLYVRKEKTIDKKWQSIRPAIDKNGEVIFKKKFTKEGLEQLRDEMGSYQFASQIMLNPIDPSQMVFKPNWVQYYSKKPDLMHYYLFVDPANTKKKRSDYTAMMVVGIDEHNNWYIVDIIRDKLNVQERVDAVFELANKWKVEKVVYETVGFQEVDAQWIREERKQQEYKFALEEVKSHTAAKEDRIRALQPPFERGQVFLSNEIRKFNKYKNKVVDYIQEFVLELQTFPMAEHDDMLDALSMILRVTTSKPHIQKAVSGYSQNSLGWLLKNHRNKTRPSKLISNYKQHIGIFNG